MFEFFIRSRLFICSYLCLSIVDFASAKLPIPVITKMALHKSHNDLVILYYFSYIDLKFSPAYVHFSYSVHGITRILKDLKKLKNGNLADFRITHVR